MTSETDEIPGDLKVLVEQAFAEARRELENTGQMRPVFFVRMPDAAIQRCQVPPGMEQMMNNGEAKRMLFAGVREWVANQGITAVGFVSDMWVNVPTDKQREMAQKSPKKLERIMRTSSFQEIERMGLAQRAEAVGAVIQNAEHVVTIKHQYERCDGHIVWGDRATLVTTQDKYTGRTKMFGVGPDTDLGERP